MRCRQVDKLLALGGVVTPSIIGKGFWFKRWSRHLQSKIKNFLQTEIPPETLITRGAFISPFDLVSSIDRASLDISTDSFKRAATSLYLVFPKLFFDPVEVCGLEFQKRRLECHSFSNWKKYQIRCDGNGRDFASYIRNTDTREKILSRYYSVFDGHEFHESLLQLLKERKKFANKLGFTSWTEMQSVANGFASEFAGSNFINSVYSKLNLKPLLAQMKRANVLPTTNLDEQFALTQLRLAKLPKNETLVAMNRRESVFEHKRILSSLLLVVGKLFRVEFQPVNTNLWRDGWHPQVEVFKVVKDGDQEIGFVYIDLFRRMSSSVAGGPHCSVLDPQNHVRVFMGLEPPYTSDITFRKERNFIFEEISALMHELGHCMHLLLRPAGSPIAQLPLDVRETVSILTELYCETDEFIDSITQGKLSPGEQSAAKRNEFFYLDILRNVAVFEFLHSTKFDPDTATVEDLKATARQVYGKYSPFPLADCFNPLGGELVNYLMDGESRIGYLAAYARASSLLAPVKSGACTGEEVFESVNNQFIQRVFQPVMSNLLESRTKKSQSIPRHPMHGVLTMCDENDVLASLESRAIWDYCGISHNVTKSVHSTPMRKKHIISKM